MALLDDAKQALRLTVNDYDGEVLDLIEAAKLDLQIAGADSSDESDPLVKRCILTYCRMHFGSPTASDYEKAERAYTFQKGQLQMSSGYTDWGLDEA